MNHGKLPHATLGLVPMLLLCACSSPDKATPPAATPTPATASPQAKEASTGVVTPPASTPAVTDTSPGPAVRAYVDPVTGQIREPTAAELRALETRKQTEVPSSAISSKPRGKETVLPNGWVKLEVDAESEMQGCVQKDGRIVAAHDCKSESATAVTKP